MRHLAVVVVVMLFSAKVFAFDIDGLKAGMSREKTIALLQSYGLTITAKDEYILAEAQGRMYSVTFCKGSLVAVQKNLKPAFETFVELVARLQSAHGVPVSLSADVPDPISSAPAHSLTILWRDKAELIGATHTAFESNSQTYINVDARNSCYEVPLLSR